jgi:hypothetical protein
LEPEPELEFELTFELDGVADGGVGGVLLAPGSCPWDDGPQADAEATAFPFCSESGVSRNDVMLRCPLKLALRRIHNSVWNSPFEDFGPSGDMSRDVALLSRYVIFTFLGL